MGKVVATVGKIVAGAALVATGVGAIAGIAVGATAAAGIGAVGAMLGGVSLSTLALVGAGLSAIGGALSKPGAQISSSTIERLTANLDLDAPRKAWFGHTAGNADVRYEEWWGASQEYFSRVVLTGGHPVESIDEIWLEEKLAWTAAGGTQAPFVGYFWAGARPQATAANYYTNDWSGRWGATCAFAGCSDVYLQFKVTGNDKKSASPFASSVPTRITIRGRGARVYDPRRDSTAGGAGTMRADDQSTWAWAPDGVEIGRNLPLQLLFYLLGWRIRNPATGEWVLSVGCGLPASDLDLDSFITAANMADEPVLKTDGTTEPRYRGDGTWSEGDDPKAVIAQFEVSMNGKLRDKGGKLSLQLFHNDLATPVVSFGPDDVLGDFTWTPGVALDQRKNVIRGRYTDPSDSALYQLVPFPEIRTASADGIDRVDTVDLPWVQSPSQAQRVLKPRLQRMQLGGSFAASFNAKGWAVSDGDPCRLTFPPSRFGNKPFRVEQGTVDPSGVVPLVLSAEDAAFYAWDADERPAVIGAAATGYDRFAGVPTPADGSWALAAGAGDLPTLVVTGACELADATGVVFELRPNGDAPWTAAGTEAPSVTRKEIAVNAGTAYQVAVSYQANGRVSATPLILGPVTSGALAAASSADIMALESRLDALEAS